MRETQRNIKRYKEQLGDVKYKIFSVGIMFVISICMLTTASFAWLVLSTNPEITNISTSIAGNGNLEIALAGDANEDNSPKVPNKSEVGDSEKDLLLRNETWGNLVNLNHESYGLQAITLRPATLNTTDLKSNPLKAVVYGTDGRVTEVDSNYSYTVFDPSVGVGGRFVTSNTTNYGVRAVSNITYENTTGATGLLSFIEAKNILGNVQNQYLRVVRGTKEDKNEPMDTVALLMGDYITAKLNSKKNSEIEVTKYVKTLYEMLEDLYECYNSTENLYLAVINAQLIRDGKPTISLSQIQGKTQSQIENEFDVNIDGYGTETEKNTFLYDKKWVNHYLDALNDEYVTATNGTGTVFLEGDIFNTVNYLVSINTVTIATKENPNKKYTINNMSASVGLELIGKTCIGTIYDGPIANMEKRLGAKMSSALTVSCEITREVLGRPMTVPASLDCEFITDENEPWTISTLIDREMAEEGGGSLTTVAGNVYGMVLDFFVRTNAANSSLTLEGEAVTEKEPVKYNGYYTYKDKNEVEYYFVPNSSSDTIDPEDSTFLSAGSFYYKEGNDADPIEFSDEQERSDFISTLDAVYELKVIGYNGANRIWQDGTSSGEKSSTQGKGSCYIFYPKNPEEQEQILQVLNAMTIAFINQEGKLLAQADLKTDLAYSDMGKVIVPIQLRLNSPTITNEYGETVYTITELEQSVEQFITAIVYLDGLRLSNSDVSAAQELSGYLNLQFGSSVMLNNMDNEKLEFESINVLATLDKSTIDYDPHNLQTAKLNVSISGVSPNKVEARFNRRVNDNQSVRQDFVTLNKTGEGSWEANVPFALPGDYVLGSVWLDGVEYNLSESLNITVNGLKINSISVDACDSSGTGIAQIMTVDQTLTTDVSVGIASNSTYLPNSVEAIFKNDRNQTITAPLTAQGFTWSGTAKFTISGTYTLEYLLIDGQHYSIPEGFEKTLSLKLGVKARVQLSEQSFIYKSSDGPRTIDVLVFLTDNKGTTLKDLDDVKLYYLHGNSAMDPAYEEVVWDASREAYKGSYSINKTGVYTFYQILIGDGSSQNRIDKADAQKLTVINPNPPKYDSYVKDELQFAPNYDAEFKLDVQYSDAADIYAVLTHDGYNGEIIATGVREFTNTSDEMSTWSFKLPKVDVNGFDYNGKWTVKELRLTNVYYEDHQYSPDNEDAKYQYLVWDMSDKDISTTVVKDVNVSVEYTGNPLYDDGKTSGYFNDHVEGNYYLSGYKVTITDSNNKIDTINQLINENELLIDTDNMALSYTFKEDPSLDWWVSVSTGEKYDPVKQTPVVKGFKENSSMVFVNSDIIPFYYSGTYSPTFTIKFTDVDRNNSNKEHIIKMSRSNDAIVVTDTTGGNMTVKNCELVDDVKVTWDRPDIIFNNVTNKDTRFETYSGSGTYKKNNTDGINTISIDGKTLKVYSQSSYSTSSGWFGSTTEKFEYTIPTAYFQLLNLDKHSGVSFTINNVNGREAGLLQGSAFKGNLKVNFSANSLTTSTLLGDRQKYSTERTLASSARPNIRCIGDDSTITQFTVTTSSGVQYTFKPSGNNGSGLVIDYDY